MKDSKNSRIPVSIFDCGHEREQAVIHMLRFKHKAPVPYQKVGDNGYCRTCMKPVKIVKVNV